MNHLPLMLTGEPWVRCPPCGRLIPRIVSPGFNAAKNTAWFACAPEWGCTLARLGAEQLLHPLDGEQLGDVDVLAAAVIALARITLGVLVGELRPLRGQHGGAGVILRGDELDVVFLASILGGDRRPQNGVGLGEGQGAVEHGGGFPATMEGELNL